MTVEFGIVKAFVPKGGYGFMYVLDAQGKKTDEEIFFHIGNGRRVGKEGETPIFLGKDPQLEPPSKGTKLVFRRRQGQQGDKASPWGYAQEWESQGGGQVQSSQQPVAA